MRTPIETSFDQIEVQGKRYTVTHYEETRGALVGTGLAAAGVFPDSGD